MPRRSAFTLIELMIAVSIIAILTGIAAVSYAGIQQRGRDASRKNDLSQVKVALSSYYASQTPAVYVSAATTVTLNGSTDIISTSLSPNYIKTIPVDPLNTGSNVYKYQSQNSAKNFKLFGTLENKNDTKGWGGGSAWVADGYILQDE
jgi:prepilin-type N-terminal cleavage/methylation domain-containing protein